MNKKIMVLVTDTAWHRYICPLLEKEGYRVTIASNAAEALRRLVAKRVDILLADTQLDETGKMGLFMAAKQIDPDISVILMDDKTSIASVVNALKAGVADYLQKPVESSVLLDALKRASEERQILLESRLLPNEVVQSSSFCGIIAKSPRMRQIFELIERVAQADSTIFVTGETGVGKELVARAIHFTGPRKNMPFIAINCGALTETLLESELFGHEKGAFTGALKSKAGKFECAHKGTLFLDEIGDISQAMQVKLLRALQEKKVERVGSNHPMDVDVRVISATNQNIKEKLERHEFRIDLFYRLNVIPMHVPPLRERAEDIPLLVQHFLERLNKNLNHNIRGIAPHAMRQLMDYPWPGNVRELENVIERAYITCDGDIIDRFSFPHQYANSSTSHDSTETVNIDIPFSLARSMVLKKFEKSYLVEALRRYQGNISMTAQKTGINPRTLWRKVNEYNLDKRSFKRKEDL